MGHFSYTAMVTAGQTDRWITIEGETSSIIIATKVHKAAHMLGNVSVKISNSKNGENAYSITSLKELIQLKRQLFAENVNIFEEKRTKPIFKVFRNLINGTNSDGDPIRIDPFQPRMPEELRVSSKRQSAAEVNERYPLRRAPPLPQRQPLQSTPPGQAIAQKQAILARCEERQSAVNVFIESATLVLNGYQEPTSPSKPSFSYQAMNEYYEAHQIN